MKRLVLFSLFTLLCAVSLILCVTCVARWIRSKTLTEEWVWTAFQTTRPPGATLIRGKSWSLKFGGGAVALEHDTANHTLPVNSGNLISRSGLRYRAQAPVRYLAPNVPPAGMRPRFQFFDIKNYLVAGDFTVTRAKWADAAVTTNYFGIRLPIWFVIAILAILPMAWEIKYRRRLWRRWRALRGLCANCGYDLRATPDRCPECGTVPASQVGQPLAGAATSAAV